MSKITINTPDGPMWFDPDEEKRMNDFDENNWNRVFNPGLVTEMVEYSKKIAAASADRLLRMRATVVYRKCMRAGKVELARKIKEKHIPGIQFDVLR